MKYLGAVVEKNSIGLVVTDKKVRIVPFIKVELGDHLYQDNDGKVSIGEPKKGGKTEELASLRERCDELGIKYVHNTGVEKLKKMIEAAEAEANNASNVVNDNNDNNDNNDSGGEEQ